MSKSLSGSSRFCLLVALGFALCVQGLGQQTSEALGGTFSTPAGGKITRAIVDRLAQPNRDGKPKATRSSASSNARTSSSTLPKASEASVVFQSTGTQLKTRE